MTSWQGANLESIANELKNIREILEKRSTTEKSSMVGEWTNAGILTVHCSNCKSQFHELEAMNYCPNCGADMRGEAE